MCVVRLRNKTSVPVYYRVQGCYRFLVMLRVIKSLVQAHSWFNSYAPEFVPMFYYRNKTRVEKFYFDSNTTVPLECVVLVTINGSAVTCRLVYSETPLNRAPGIWISSD